MGVFDGIGDKVGDHLLYTSVIDLGHECRVWIVFDECHTGLLDTGLQRLTDVVEALGEVHFPWYDLDATVINCRDGQDVVDESHEHVAVVHDHPDDLLLLFGRGEHGQHV